MTRLHFVRIESYSLETGRIGETVATVYESSHRSPRAAARRLGEMINGKTSRAAKVRKAIGAGLAGRYMVDGMALNPFRRMFENGVTS